MITAGIDQSINSTGITIWDGFEHHYFQIVPRLTKKMQSFKDKHIHIIKYDKINSLCEVDKFKSLCSLVDVIESILLDYKVEQVILEGIAFGAFGRTSDLTGLNYLIRNVCYNNDIQFVIIPPTTVKKEFSGNGAADKDIMIESFLKCTKHSKEDFPGKIDDIADSYALCHLPQYIIDWYETH